MHPSIELRIEGPRGCGYRRSVWTLDEIEAMPHGENGGYVIVYPPGGGRYRTAGREFKHRLVMEATLGRHLSRSEVVHHHDEDKTNNAPVNLILTGEAAHARYHRLKTLGMIADEEPNDLEFDDRPGEHSRCEVCNKTFYLSGGDRRKNRRTCSIKCGARLPGAIANHARNLTGRKEDFALNAPIVALRDSGMTRKQVAEMTNVPYGGVRDRYSRTKR